MRLEAIYDQGKLEFSQPIQLRSTRLRLLVEVPDQEILPSPPLVTPIEQAQTKRKFDIRERIDAILGADRASLRGHKPMTPKRYQKVWHEHLEEKYLGGE